MCVVNFSTSMLPHPGHKLVGRLLRIFLVLVTIFLSHVSIIFGRQVKGQVLKHQAAKHNPHRGTSHHHCGHLLQTVSREIDKASIMKQSSGMKLSLVLWLTLKHESLEFADVLKNASQCPQVSSTIIHSRQVSGLPPTGHGENGQWHSLQKNQMQNRRNHGGPPGHGTPTVGRKHANHPS